MRSSDAIRVVMRKMPRWTWQRCCFGFLGVDKMGTPFLVSSQNQGNIHKPIGFVYVYVHRHIFTSMLYEW